MGLSDKPDSTEDLEADPTSLTPAPPQDDNAALNDVFTEVSEEDWFRTDEGSLLEIASGYRVASPALKDESIDEFKPPGAPSSDDGPQIFTNVNINDINAKESTEDAEHDAFATGEGWPSLDSSMDLIKSAEDPSQPGEAIAGQPDGAKRFGRKNAKWRVVSEDGQSEGEGDAYIPSEQEIADLRRAYSLRGRIDIDDVPTNVFKSKKRSKPEQIHPADPLIRPDPVSGDVWTPQDTFVRVPDIEPFKVEPSSEAQLGKVSEYTDFSTDPPSREYPMESLPEIEIPEISVDDAIEPEIVPSTERSRRPLDSQVVQVGPPMPDEFAVAPQADPFQHQPTMPYIAPAGEEPPKDDTTVALVRPGPADLEQVGTFELVPNSIDPHLLVLHDPEGDIASRYRLLDFKLRQIAEGRPARTVAITSPVAGSGTTLTAINLSLIRAESPHARVALVDLNFRNPSMARFLGLRPTFGLPQYILEQAPLEKVLLRMEGTQCYLLPSTPTEVLPSRLYKHHNLTRLFGRLYETFDLIVMDLPPVLPQADINQVNNLIDVISLVVAAGRTLGPDVKRATETIDTDKLVGIVLNDLRS